MTNPIATMASLIDQFCAVRRQYAQWIVLTNDCEGENQRAARHRADEIKADIATATALMKAGRAQAAHDFLARRR
jgi:hypothetical protein